MDFTVQVNRIWDDFVNGNRKDARDAIHAHGPEFAAAVVATLTTGYSQDTATDLSFMLIRAYHERVSEGNDSRLKHICVDCFAQFEERPVFADCPACVHGTIREHKGIHTIPEWREAVLQGDTKMGYVAWLDSNLAQDARSEVS